MKNFINSFGINNLIVIGVIFFLVILALIILLIKDKKSKNNVQEENFYIEKQPIDETLDLEPTPLDTNILPHDVEKQNTIDEAVDTIDKVNKVDKVDTIDAVDNVDTSFDEPKIIYEEKNEEDSAKKALEEVTKKLLSEDLEEELVGPTDFELEQEERSVISYDELKKLKVNIDETNDNLLKDDGNEPITIEELYQRHIEEQAQEEKDANPIFEDEDVKEDALIKHEELINEKEDEVKEIKDDKKFKNSLVISPVFGIWQNKDINHKDIDILSKKSNNISNEILNNFDTYNSNEGDKDIDIEIKKTEEFLHELKKLKSKLD